MPYNQPQNPGLLTRLNSLNTGYAYSVLASVLVPGEPGAYVLLERDHSHDRYVVCRADLRDCSVHGGRYVTNLPRAYQIFGEYVALTTTWSKEGHDRPVVIPGASADADWDLQAESYGGRRRVLCPVVGTPADGMFGCVAISLGRPNTVLAASVSACGTRGMVLVGFAGAPTPMCNRPYRLYTLASTSSLPLDSVDYEHDVDAWSAFSLGSVSRMGQTEQPTNCNEVPAVRQVARVENGRAYLTEEPVPATGEQPVHRVYSPRCRDQGQRQGAVCSEDGCYRTSDCGPACRNRN